MASQSMSNKILLAGALGFVAGILYAPRKGTETQAKLKQKVEGMKSEVENKAKQAKSKFENIKSDKVDKELDKIDKKADKVADNIRS